MGQIASPVPVAPLLAVCSRHPDAFEWTIDQATQAWGSIALQSPSYEFRETDYYRETMGDDLRKGFLVFERLWDPADLAGAKLATNAWEESYAKIGQHPEVRPLNLDPGYLTLAKLVLASTKDHSHRVYVGQGIYAEVTLYYKNRGWQPREWTYPDYRRTDFQEFFSSGRAWLNRRLRKERRP